MKPVFADAFFFIAALSKRDAHHETAREFLRNLTSPIVTTVWVLVEVADGFAAPQTRGGFNNLLEFLDKHPGVMILPVDVEQFRRGTDLYRLRPDKGWSLTDCISFEVMKRMGLREALTGDHHFEQAGFVALLK
jgi:predicted nucleic acid-binding protein